MTPQPNAPSYSISDLNLFPTYPTMAAALAAGVPVVMPGGDGIQVYDPTLPQKGWIGSGTFNFFNASIGTERTATIPASQHSIKLTGPLPIPAAPAPDPTPAYMLQPGGAQMPVNANNLCTQAQADAFVLEVKPRFNVPLTAVEQSNDTAFPIEWGTETRRLCNLKVGSNWQYGYAYSIGLEMFLKASATGGGMLGGSWQIISQQGEPATLTFVAQQQITVAPAGASTTPPAIRALAPDEEFQQDTAPGPFGATTWVVVRTDIQSAAAQNLAAVEAALKVYNETPGVMQQLALTPVVG